jgi:hypothetical protein
MTSLLHVEKTQPYNNGIVDLKPIFGGACFCLRFLHGSFLAAIIPNPNLDFH